MRGLAGLLGTFLPFVVLLLSCWGPVTGRGLWRISLLLNLVSWACFVFLSAGFYTGNIPPDGLASSPLILAGHPWSEGLGLQWDFQSAILSLAASSVIVCFHFLARRKLEISRATTAGVCAYLGCLLGALGAGQLMLFSIFFAGSLLPRFIFTGADSRGAGINAVRESAFLGILALFSLLLVVLAFSAPFKESLSSWFQLSSSTRVVLPGAIGLSLLLFATTIGAGIFPFHGNARKVFELETMERAVPLALQPLFGFVILFRFAVDLFPGEFQSFSPYLQGFFSLALAASAVSFFGSRSSRERVFWLQQAVNCLVAVGFFSLNRKGWHGASVLLLFQSLVFPFFLIVLTCHERRPALPIARIAEFPAFALTTAAAVLFTLFLPVSIGFYGVLLVVWSLVEHREWFLPFVIVAIPIIVIGGITTMFFRLGGNRSAENKSEFQDLTFEEMVAIFPIGIVLLLLGLVPKVLMGPMGVSASALLKSMGIQV